MKVLITGICGFAGSALAMHWIDADPGLMIYGFDNLTRPGSETNRPLLRKLGVRLFHGDLRIASDLEMLPSVEWVIDAAANTSVLTGMTGENTSRQLVEHNLLGTVNLLEFCKTRGSGLVLLSTSRVYSIPLLAGLPVEPVGEKYRLSSEVPLPPGISKAGITELFSTAAPVSLYGSTKLASELLALEYSDAYRFPVRINRCGVLAGAGQFGRPDQGIFSYWIHAWHRRRPLSYFGFGGKGYQVRDCLHPRDLVPLLRKQVAKETAPVRIVNIGGGADRAISLAELSGWCSDRLGPHTVCAGDGTRPFDVPWLVMDSALAGEAWEWQPQTPLSSILEETAQHAEQHPDWLEISGAL